MSEPRFEKDGWCYQDKPGPHGDCRKLVTLEQQGMTWVGIRAYNHSGSFWMNGNEPLNYDERVKAWRDLPTPGEGWWDRGQLRVPPYGASDQREATTDAAPKETR